MTLEDAQRLDAADPLAFARDRFRVPDATIYLDGNSLGALPAETAGRLAQTVEREWGDDLIASWNRHGWIDAPARVAAKLAPMVGAKPDELLIADSTSINLFKLLAAAVRARPGRKTILTQQRQFPDRPLRRPGPGRDARSRTERGSGRRDRSSDRRRHRGRDPDPRRLPQRRDPRHGGDQRSGARRRRADGVGPVAQRRRDRSSTSTAPAATSRSAAATNI